MGTVCALIPRMRTNLPRYSLLLVILSAAASPSVACSSTGDGAAAGPEADITEAKNLLDVNDVSILFGRTAAGSAGAGEPVPSILASETAEDGSELFPQADFDRVIAFATGGIPGKPETNPAIKFVNGGDKRENWRIFAMRFDPCAPTFKLNAKTPDPALQANLALIGIPPVCLVQVRLIAQPVIVKNGITRDQDITAHLVYTLGALPALRDRVAGDMMNDLMAIKTASEQAGAQTSGQPLGVHPGLAAEGKSGKAGTVAGLVKAFIKKNTGKASRAIAFMGLRNDGFEPWTFFPGSVKKDATEAAASWKPVPIPSFIKALSGTNTPDPATFQFHERLSFLETQHIVPAPSQAISTAPLFREGPNGPLAPSEAEKALAFQVEEPNDHHLPNTDCVSCHTSSARIADLNIQSTPDRVRVPSRITGYVRKEDGQGSVWNVRNFGYFAGKPTVSLRTANETVGVVQFMNLEIVPTSKNPGRLNGPGRDCTAKDDEVFNCFLAGSGDKCVDVCGPLAKDVPDTSPEPPPPPPVDPPPGPRVDPCTATSASNVTVSADGATATLTDTNAECLSRLMNGSFLSLPVDISCTNSNTCTIAIHRRDVNGPALKQVKLDDAIIRKLATRLNRTFGAAPSADGSKRFATTVPANTAASDANFAGITCTSAATFNKRAGSCTVSIARGRKLP